MANQAKRKMDDYIVKWFQQLQLLPKNRYRSHAMLHKLIATAHCVTLIIYYSFLVYGLVADFNDGPPEHPTFNALLLLAILTGQAPGYLLWIFSGNVSKMSRFPRLQTMLAEVDAILLKYGCVVETSASKWRFGCGQIVLVIFATTSWYEPLTYMNVFKAWCMYVELLQLPLITCMLENIRRRWATFNELILRVQITPAALLDLMHVQAMLHHIVGTLMKPLEVFFAFFTAANFFYALSEILMLMYWTMQMDQFLLAMFVNGIYPAFWTQIIVKCTQLRRLGKCTSMNCYMLSTQHVLKHQMYVDTKSTDLLQQLANFSAHVVPEFMAAGVFYIDMASVLLIINMITTYIIAIIQFESKSF